MPAPDGFADYGVESEALSAYGEVTRATVGPKTNDYSDTVVADLSDLDDLQFSEDQFDLAFLAPSCTAYSDMLSANKHGDALDLTPRTP